LKIAYFSPLPPARTGIATYSAELISALEGVSDVRIFTSTDTEWRSSLGKKPINFASNPLSLKTLGNCDGILYHVGNNPWFHSEILQALRIWRGHVVLHDLVLYFLFAGFGFGSVAKAILENFGHRKAEEVWGIQAASPDGNILRYRHPERYPFLKLIVDNAKGLIVHNETSARHLEAFAPEARVDVVPLLHYATRNSGVEPGLNVRGRLGIAAGTVIIGVFGFIGPTKRIDKLLLAVRKILKDSPKLPIKLLIVGEGDEITRQVSEGALQDHVIQVGFVPDFEFKEYLNASDIIVNLRYPSMGESSASLIQAMAAAKPTIVTNDASFAEFPDDVVVKCGFGETEVSEIADALQQLVVQPERRLSLGLRAKTHIESFHAPSVVARQFLEILQTPRNESPRNSARSANGSSNRTLEKTSVRVVKNNAVFRLARPLRVLLIKLDHRGDLVLAAPAIRNVAARFPNANIDIVVGSWNREICQEIFSFKNVFTLDFFSARSDVPPEYDTPGLDTMLAEMPDYYDIAIDLRRSPDTRFVLQRVRARLKVAYATHTESDNKITVCLPQEDDNYEIGMLKEKNKRHLSLQLIELIDAIPVREIHHPKRELGTAPTQISIFPGAGQAIREWPIQKFLDLIERLSEVEQIDRINVLLSSSESESPYREIQAQSGKVLVYRGASTHEFLEVIKGSRIVIANNSGGAHMASLYGVATLVIFGGPEWWEEWAPTSPVSKIIFSAIPCFPCHLDRLERCTHQHACLQDISVLEVFSTAMQMLVDVKNDDERAYLGWYLAPPKHAALWSDCE